MESRSINAIIQSLNQHQVRYLIVGGLAVVAHGHIRFTADVDLVLAIDTPNLASAIGAIKSLGYIPRVPVAIEEFQNAESRRRWATEKQMKVFSLFSDVHPKTTIDLFLEPPFDFDGAFSRAIEIEVAPGIPARFCGFDDLIELKRQAGRPLDLDDIEKLRRLREASQ